jgi:hypothetical protein
MLPVKRQLCIGLAVRGRRSAHRGGSERRRRPLRTEPEPTMVRSGSARHQTPLVPGGHERSRPANHNRRSQGIHRHDLGRRNGTGPGSSPSSGTSRWCAMLLEPICKEGRHNQEHPAHQLGGPWCQPRLGAAVHPAAAQSVPLGRAPLALAAGHRHRSGSRPLLLCAQRALRGTWAGRRRNPIPPLGRALQVPIAPVPDGPSWTTAVGRETPELRPSASYPGGAEGRTRLPSSGPLGHIGATSGPRTAGSQRTTAVTSGPLPPSSQVTFGQTPQVAVSAQRSLTRKGSQVQTLSRPPTRR